MPEEPKRDAEASESQLENKTEFAEEEALVEYEDGEEEEEEIEEGEEEEEEMEEGEEEEEEMNLQELMNLQNELSERSASSKDGGSEEGDFGAILEQIASNGGLLQTLFANAPSEESHQLHLASQEGDLDTVRKIIDSGEADVNDVDLFRYNALHFAAEGGFSELLRFLVSKKGNVEAVTKLKEFRPIHYAAFNGHLECIKILVDEANANMNAQTEDGQSPVYQAALAGHKEVVEFLKSKGADLFLKDKNGQTSVDVCGDAKILKILRDE